MLGNRLACSVLAQNRTKLYAKARLAVELCEARLWAACGFRLETLEERAKRNGRVWLPETEVRPIVLWLEQVRGSLIECEYNAQMGLGKKAAAAKIAVDEAFEPWDEILQIEAQYQGRGDRQMTYKDVLLLKRLRSAVIRFARALEKEIALLDPGGAGEGEM